MRKTSLSVLLLTLTLPASVALAAPAIRFAEWDADHDGRITLQEWKGNAVSFAQQDTNSDGVLAGTEVAAAAAAPARGGTGQAGVHDKGRLERLFRKLDGNKDGRLTPAELKATEKFARLDLNHDRVVSRDEYMKQ